MACLQSTVPRHKPNNCQSYFLRQREIGAVTPWSLHKLLGSRPIAERLSLSHSLVGHTGCVNTVYFNQSAELLLSGSDDCNVVIWNWALKKQKLVYDSGHRANVFQARVMPNTDDSVIVTCAADGLVRVGHKTEGSGYETSTVGKHRSSAHKLAIEPDSPHVFLSCGEDGRVCEYDLRVDKRKEETTLLTCYNDQKERVELNSVALNPFQPNLLVLGGGDEYVRVYDRRLVSKDKTKYASGKGTCQKFTSPDLFTKKNNNSNSADKKRRRSHSLVSITCAVYSFDGSEILATYNDDLVYLFDARRQEEEHFLKKYDGHRNMRTVKAVNFFGPRSEYVVSGSDCGHIFLWDKETEEVVNMMKGDDYIVNCLEPHPYEPILATSGIEHDVKIWAPIAQKPFDKKHASDIMELNRKKREQEEQGFLREDMLTNLIRLYSQQNDGTSDEDDEDGDDDESPPFVCRQS